MATKRDPKPKSTGEYDPHIFAAKLEGPRDYKGEPIECEVCPFPRLNAVHKSSEELVADLPETPADDVSDRIIGEGG